MKYILLFSLLLISCKPSLPEDDSNITSECDAPFGYDCRDINVLKSFIKINSQIGNYMDYNSNGIIDPLEFGYQAWDENGRLVTLDLNYSPNIIAVSKTFDLKNVLPLINHGHVHFGENKVQEASAKWDGIKNNFPNIKIHMLGKLQSNKAKKAVEIFDFIHSLDSEKLANNLKKNEEILNKKLNYFIQVNVGNENQKSGIKINEITEFYNFCSKAKKLKIIGLMAIPPNDGNEESHFKILQKLNESLGLNELSMGMSADYEVALKFKATFLRIGTSIFGKRN